MLEKEPGLKLGEALVSSGDITEAQLSEALCSQRQTGGKLGETLVNLGILSQTAMVKTLASKLGVPGTYLRHGLIDPAVVKLVDRDESERLKVLPMFKVRDRLIVAMAEPQNLPAIDRLVDITGCEIKSILALESNIKEFAHKYHNEEVAVDDFLVSLSESNVQVVEHEGAEEGMITDLDQMVEGSPIINLVNLAMLSAIRDGASDIHIEPDRKKTRIRYRIDGVLRDLMKPPAGMHSAIVSRVKVIGKMDIAEKRLPQEGRVHIIAEGHEIDLRVSSMPTLLGEKIVIRILDKTSLNTDMKKSGFRPETFNTFQHMLLRPHGIVLVTGPTGSGKTTTLYSALDLLRSVERNIVTVEDPVEYQLDLINQIQVNESIGLTFSRALRSILRQDPDVIMVGEIRDSDTARVAIQAALTGHMVLSTLHTNDCPSSLTRIIDMGVEPYLVASALNGIVAQRLARTICPSCKTSYYPAETTLAEAGWSDKKARAFQRGNGCRQCHESGFRGRTGIYEVMEVDDELRSLIQNGANEQEMRRYLISKNHQDLRQEGLRIVEGGNSTLEEVLRVTHIETKSSIRAEQRPKTRTEQSAQKEPEPQIV
ncbi:MAG: GspE/PulE family protein [Planctomycetota bacterium]|jgi:type IV pilus assembly protein PilB